MLGSFQEFEDLLARSTNYERMPGFKHDKETLSLDRMLEVVEAIGRPDQAYPTIHIAGTKGKGSTTLILEALLRAEGLAVGTYTSPHVEHLRERIRIDGSPVGEALLLAHANKLLSVLEALRSRERQVFPTFFELMTALAMDCFRDRRVHWGLFEVGLGGRLDATNVLAPRLTCITSIGLEHTQQLGNTLESIAGEKAGIVKERTPLVLGPLAGEALQPILRAARLKEAPVEHLEAELVRPAGPDRLEIGSLGAFRSTAVIGPALRADLGLAFLLCSRALKETGLSPRREHVASALETLVLPARVERFPLDPPVVVDAAHTAESIRALRITLDEVSFPRPRTLIFSVAAGKNLPGILAELPELAEETIWTLADPARSIPPERLRSETGRGTVLESPGAALDTALSRGCAIVVTGSFYLAGALRPRVRALAGASRHFF